MFLCCVVLQYKQKKISHLSDHFETHVISETEVPVTAIKTFKDIGIDILAYTCSNVAMY